MPAITRELNVIARCGNKYRGEKLKHLQLTAAQAPYVLHICSRPGLSQEDLARALHVNPSSATRQLALLEEAGYVTRASAPGDKRLLIVNPTDKARAAFPAIRRVNARWQDYLTQGLSEQEKQALERLLEHVRARAVSWMEERS